MNKKLRLLLTTRCPNKCPMCCNNSWDFSRLPVVDRWNYEQIMFTGGEPLLMVDKLCALADSIRRVLSTMGLKTKIYVYTAICEQERLSCVLNHVDGIVLTPHKKEDIEPFKKFNELVDASNSVLSNSIYKEKSPRLNLFPDIKKHLEGVDLQWWQVKDIEWIKDCPVPEGEDFRRVALLW